MKNLFSSGKLAAALMAALLGFGCVNVEYVGQSLPPLPEDEPVAIFTPDSKMPPDQYRPIGWAYLTAPEGRSKSTIFDALGEVAREHGADAVNIVSFKNVPIGNAAEDESFSGGPSWNNTGRTFGGEQIYFDSFGERADVAKAETFTEQRVKALILVNVVRYEKMRAEYLKNNPPAVQDVPAAAAAPKSETVAEKTAADAQKSIKIKKQPVKGAEPVRIKLSDDREQPAAL